MLQFITVNNIEPSVVEQVRLAIEGGCGWIQLSVDGLDLIQQKKLAEEVITLCQPNDVFLTIEHNVDLVEELKVHGVHLFPGDMLPREARERLGAHAVVGVTVRNAEQVISLRSADIDYVQIGPYPDVTLDDYSKIVAAVQEAGVKIPVVATGNINPEDVQALLATGVKGVGVSNPIALSGDIKEVVEKFLAV